MWSNKKYIFLEGKIDFRVFSESANLVMKGKCIITICWNEVVVVKDLLFCVCVRGALKNRWGQEEGRKIWL